MLKRWNLRLAEASDLSPSVRSLIFEVADAERMLHEPGEVLDLFVPLPQGLPAKRPYSIASAVGQVGPGRVEIAVTRVPDGQASVALHEQPIGAELAAEGPRGSLRRFTGEQDEPVLFVAAGSGLAPLRAMLHEELARASGPPVALLFGCRTRADVLWADELRGWASRHERFQLEVTLSRPDAEWSGRTGYVQTHVADLASSLRPTRAYACGLVAMVDAVADELRAAGLTQPGAIRTEAYDI